MGDNGNIIKYWHDDDQGDGVPGIKIWSSADTDISTILRNVASVGNIIQH